MRNLKRALSLALASVMLLGMMVVGTSAASYPDVDDKDNVEAIEVLNAAQVMIGEQGNFNPDGAVNRHAMAVIMAKLYLGVEAADNYVGSHPFTDVVPWADKYVAACYENGLVAGTSATTYGGNNPLTAVQAAAMMLRALGYKDLSKGADNWSVPVTATANQLRLFSGVASNPKEQLTRNQVAQLALNTLKSPMVTMTDNTFDVTSGEGNVVISGGSREYKVRFSQEDYAYAINDTERAGNSASGIQGATIELGEHLYNGKLQLNNVTDDFGRPARRWEYNGKTIGTYIKEELVVKEYVGKVTGKDLYDQLGSTIVNEYDMLVTIDGVDKYDSAADQTNAGVFGRTSIDKNNKAAVGRTGTGTLTQVFVDNRNLSAQKSGELYIAVINTYLAKANQDYDAKKEELSVTIHGVNKPTSTSNFIKDSKVNRIGDAGTGSTVTNAKLALEDFSIVKDMKKDEFLLVNVAGSDVVAAEKPEILSGVSISGFKKNSDVVVDGTKYEFTTTAHYKDSDLAVYTSATATSTTINLQDATYNVYLDVYGNLIGVEEVNPTKNYVFITGNDRSSSNYTNKTAKALGLFLDGTSEELTYKTDKIGAPAVGVNNVWCTYTKDKSGVYTLKQVGDKLDIAKGVELAQFNTNETTIAEFTIDSKNSTLLTNDDGVIYGKADSVYLVADRGVLGRTDAGTVYGAVKGTDTLIVDVKKADIAVWSSAYALNRYQAMIGGSTITAPNYCYGAYALYNKDYGIIAAVVIGEDNGVSKKWYNTGDEVLLHEDYITSSADTKAADGTGEWVWTRELFDEAGNRVTLTERGDNASFLQHMNPNQDYLIKLNGKGEVYKAYRLPSDEAGTVKELEDVVTAGQVVVYQAGQDNSKAEVVTDYTKIGDAVKTGKNQMLVSCDNLVGRMNTSQSGLLYVKSGNDDSGILVTDDTKVVLVQYNRNAKTTYEDGVGFSAVKGIIDGLNQRYGTNDYNYKVSAVLDSRKAKSIMIYDYTRDWNAAPGTSTDKDKSSQDLANGKITLVAPAYAKVDHLYAVVKDDGELDFRFFPQGIGADGTGYIKYSYTIKDDQGNILDDVKNATSATDVDHLTGGAVTVASSNKIYTTDQHYTIEITKVSATVYKLEMATDTKTAKADAGNDGGLTKTVAVGGSNLYLKLKDNAVTFNDKVTVKFTVSNIKSAALQINDTDVLVENTAATEDNGAGVYTYTGAVNATKGMDAVQLLKNVVPSGKGPVTVTINDISDSSEKAKIVFELGTGSEWAELTGMTEVTVDTDTKITALNPTDLKGDSGSTTNDVLKIKYKDSNCVVKTAKATYLWKEESNKNVGQTTGTIGSIDTTGVSVGAGNINLNDTPEAKEIITIVVNLAVDTYEIPAANFNITKGAGVGTFTLGAITFDKDGKYSSGTVTGNSTDSVLMKFGTKDADGNDAEYFGGTNSSTITVAAGAFSLPANVLMNSNTTKIPVDVQSAVKLTSTEMKANPAAANSATVTGLDITWRYYDGASWVNVDTTKDLYVYASAAKGEKLEATVKFNAAYTKQASGANDTLNAGGACTIGTTLPTGVTANASNGVNIVSAAENDTITFTWTGTQITAAGVVLTLDKGA